MGVVYQAIQDAVGQRRITDLFMPARDRQLRSQDRGARLVAILADLLEVAAFRFTERRHRPVVDHQHFDATEPKQQIA